MPLGSGGVVPRASVFGSTNVFGRSLAPRSSITDMMPSAVASSTTRRNTASWFGEASK